MKRTLPNYSKIYELTKRRLRGLKKLAEKRENFGMPEMMLLTLLGNMNQRLDTMFHLLELGITDGIYPLQRTFFEMLIAYKAMLKSDDKDCFVEFYKQKNSFETTNKVNRMLSSSNSSKELFEDWEKIYVKNHRNESQETLKESAKNSPLKGNKSFKLWYELASGKSLQELSEEFGIESQIFYLCYDEPSNWVHPQRIEMNINIDNFERFIDSTYYHNHILVSLLQSSVFLNESMADFAMYIRVINSSQLVKYGETIWRYQDKLRKYIEQERKKNFDEDVALKISEKIKETIENKM